MSAGAGTLSETSTIVRRLIKLWELGTLCGKRGSHLSRQILTHSRFYRGEWTWGIHCPFPAKLESFKTSRGRTSTQNKKNQGTRPGGLIPDHTWHVKSYWTTIHLDDNTTRWMELLLVGLLEATENKGQSLFFKNMLTFLFGLAKLQLMQSWYTMWWFKFFSAAFFFHSSLQP